MKESQTAIVGIIYLPSYHLPEVEYHLRNRSAEQPHLAINVICNTIIDNSPK